MAWRNLGKFGENCSRSAKNVNKLPEQSKGNFSWLHQLRRHFLLFLELLSEGWLRAILHKLHKQAIQLFVNHIHIMCKEFTKCTTCQIQQNNQTRCSSKNCAHQVFKRSNLYFPIALSRGGEGSTRPTSYISWIAMQCWASCSAGLVLGCVTCTQRWLFVRIYIW